MVERERAGPLQHLRLANDPLPGDFLFDLCEARSADSTQAWFARVQHVSARSTEQVVLVRPTRKPPVVVEVVPVFARKQVGASSPDVVSMLMWAVGDSHRSLSVARALQVMLAVPCR